MMAGAERKVPSVRRTGNETRHDDLQANPATDAGARNPAPDPAPAAAGRRAGHSAPLSPVGNRALSGLPRALAVPGRRPPKPCGPLPGPDGPPPPLLTVHLPKSPPPAP